MAYSAEISRDHPTCILFIIDQSGSMCESMGSRSKAEFVADVLNKTLYTLVSNCTKSDGVRNYFDIGVIGYGGEGPIPALGGVLEGGIVHSVTAIAECPLRVEDRVRKEDDGAGGILERRVKFPVWFDAINSGGTPMRAALIKAAEVLVEWCDSHPSSYPPTVIHLTDGESTDGDPRDLAASLQEISTEDGACLLFNIHASRKSGDAISFPTSAGGLADPLAQFFNISSELPPHVARLASDKGYSISTGARGFIFRAGAEEIVNFFDIGTRPRLTADR